MSIDLGGEILYYTTNSNKYIITYTSLYDDKLNIILDNLFNDIFPHYSSKKLEYSNTCGQNSQFICNLLKNIEGIISGKLIITKWNNPDNIKIFQSIETVYGSISNTMGVGTSYHALVYLEINIDDMIYYIAIETTKCIPYKLQFYIGNSKEEFEQIIKIRYQCIEFKVEFNCNKSWIEIAYSGGKSKKVKKIKKYKKIKKNKSKRKIRKESFLFTKI
jgi:hypothetical protein